MIRFAMAKLREAKAAEEALHEALLAASSGIDSSAVDRSLEFTEVGGVTSGRVYVCDPHATKLRSTNENWIGRLLFNLPKGTSVDKVSLAGIKRIEHKQNHTPRAALGYLTPLEVALDCPPPSGIPCWYREIASKPA
jgi:IS30 family transposase